MFNKKLQELRKEYNMTQQKLATYLKVARPTVTCYENGTKMPSFEKLIEIAKLFNVSTDYLLGVSEEKGIEAIGLSEEEKELLKKYRNLSEEDKEKLLSVIGILSTQR